MWSLAKWTLMGCVLVGLGQLALAPAALAEDLQRVVVEGTVSEVNPPLNETIAVGDPWRVEYTIDLDVAPVFSSSERSTFQGAIEELHFTISRASDGVVLHEASTSSVSIQVANKAWDQFNVITRALAPDPLIPSHFYLKFWDYDGTVWDDSALPKSLDLQEFEVREIYYDYLFDAGRWYGLSSARLIGAVTSFTMTPLAVNVEVDIAPNAINLKSKGKISVAILSTDDFDATEVDADMVELGDPTLTGRATPVKMIVEDVDGDGVDDLLLKFERKDLVDDEAIDGDSTSLELTGKTKDGTAIRGSDTVKIVLSKK